MSSIINFFADLISGEWMKNIIRDMYNVSLKWMGYELSLDNIYESIKNICNFTHISTNTYGLYSIVTTVNKFLVTVGLSLLVLFFVINMAQKAMEIERISWDKIVMEIVKFLFFKFLVQNSLMFFETILTVTNNYFLTLAGQISNIGTIGSVATVGSILADNMGDGWGAIGNFVVLLFLWIAYVGSYMGVMVPVITVQLKIIFSLAIAPIPIACGAFDSRRDTAKSFIMSVVALGLETWMMLIFARIYLIGLSSINSSDGIFAIGLGLIFSNALLAAVFGWGTQKVQALVGGN